MKWRRLYHAEKEYLSANKDYMIIKTIYSEENDETKKMELWCKQFIVDCWSIASVNDRITFRMWNKAAIKKFIEKFKGQIEN